jgi:hypothetical protein
MLPAARFRHEPFARYQPADRRPTKAACVPAPAFGAQFPQHLVYRFLSGNLIYNDPGATAYHQLNRARELKSLRKRAKLLGFELVDRSFR